jgi:hypothetical protein
MNLALLAAGFVLVALPGWTSSLGRRLLPRDWVSLSAMSLQAGLVAVRVGLAVTAVPPVLRGLDVDVFEVCPNVCHRMVVPRGAGGALTALASLTVLAVLQLRIVRVRRRCRHDVASMRVESWLGGHHDYLDHELVTVPTASSLAYAVDGSPPQIVISEGLARTLSHRELTAVVGHERCHLQYSHQRHLELARVAEAVFPRLRATRRSAVTLRLAVERWADEVAAEQTDRASLRSALEKVVVTMIDAVPAITTAETFRVRLDALGASPQPTPRHGRVGAVTPAVVLAVTAGAALLTGNMFVPHALFSLIGQCPL